MSSNITNTARAKHHSDLSKKEKRLKLHRFLEPYLYLSPSLILLILMIFVPLVIGFSFAFQYYSLLDPFERGYAGLAHFKKIASDPYFWISLKNTIFWTFGSLFFQFFLGLFLALLLRQKFRGRGIIQAIVFVPWAVPTFLTGLTWAWLFNPTIGPIPHWLSALHIMSEPINILGDEKLAMIGPIVANIWFGIPFFAITLLAALQSIPEDFYEAAKIDGASPWQCFIHITLPFLAPMISITVLLRTIWIANFADLIYVMTNGGPANSTQILSTYVFTTAFKKLDFGYASALALILLILMTLYAAILLNLRKKLIKI